MMLLRGARTNHQLDRDKRGALVQQIHPFFTPFKEASVPPLAH